MDRLYGEAMREALKKTNTVSTLVLDVREETKSMKYVEAVCAEAMAHGLNRKGLLIGFGGGVCLDVVTVAASLIRRGVGHLRVPTTLIGQIDAGIGLKGAVNFAGKAPLYSAAAAPHALPAVLAGGTKLNLHLVTIPLEPDTPE